jgi:hypothetical protein
MTLIEQIAQANKPQFKAMWVVNDGITRDIVAFCPTCKAMETVSITAEGMVGGRKFTQKDSSVFHDCGSKVPCRLYGLS